MGTGRAEPCGPGFGAALQVAGDHPAGEHHGDADAFGGELVAERLAEAEHGELAGLVGGHPHRRREDAEGRGEDDAPEAVACPEQGRNARTVRMVPRTLTSSTHASRHR